MYVGEPGGEGEGFPGVAARWGEVLLHPRCPGTLHLDLSTLRLRREDLGRWGG